MVQETFFLPLQLHVRKNVVCQHIETLLPHGRILGAGKNTSHYENYV